MTAKAYRRILLDKKAEFLEALGTNRQELAEPEAEDRVGADADKIAHDEFVLLRVNQSLYSQLRQVEDALDRLELGEYGRCLGCGTAIPPKRLEAVPWARFCITCQENASGFLAAETAGIGKEASL